MPDLLDNFISFFPMSFWAIIKALIVLLLAFIVSAIVKSLVMRLMKKAFVGKVVHTKDAEATRVFVGKLAYLLVFLLFVPGILDSLDLHSVSAPLLALLNNVWGYVPNVLAAAIILIVGIRISNLIRQLLVPVLKKARIDRLQERLGISVPETAELSSTVAYVIYVLILIPVVIAALSVLNIAAISQPAIAMLNTIIQFMPNIAVGIVIAILGIFIGKLAGQVVEKLLSASGIDSKVSALLEPKAHAVSVSNLTGRIVNVVVILFFLVEAVNVLHLQVLSGIGEAVIAYMPNALAGLIIILGAVALSLIASKFLQKYSALCATIVKAAILVVGAFMMLSQLGIAKELVNAGFIVVIGAVAVAFGLSFGFGGKKFAANMLERIERRLPLSPAAGSDASAPSSDTQQEQATEDS
ncbi:mechanosensitive ion channel [Evtepia sp.]|uniref:mechanosensitive ion channel n=1 Tax=Evtepia sp. TaxID=2773933 RepID=UPI002A75C4C8|nr:mechanosensitive ion channel [Evtepia sp.]